MECLSVLVFDVGGGLENVELKVVPDAAYEGVETRDGRHNG